MANTAKTVKLDSIHADWKRNPRGAGAKPSVSDPDAFKLLCESIEHHGLLTPILVTPEGEGFRVVAGYRRFEAATVLGLETIPVLVKEDLSTTYTVGEGEETEERSLDAVMGELAAAAAENSARADISVWDKCALARSFEVKGFRFSEIETLCAEAGHKATPNTVRVWAKVGSLSAKLRKRLAALGSKGYEIARAIITKDFNLAEFPLTKWDVVKQEEEVDRLIKKAMQEKESKKKGEKGEKKPRWSLKADELAANLAVEGAQDALGMDLFLVLSFLIGNATRGDVAREVGKDVVEWITGEGDSTEEDEEAGE